ncbi:MAG TPA: hypothetical protein OIM60_03475 [Clostridiaceae bacterium]|nr:hypothetical protein [Clostridiaceae bacterium]
MIEVNEYVRTINGVIDKVDALYGMIENTVHLENQKWFDTKNIVKHSKQLIDLIEVGDFVNGYRVLAIEDSIYVNSKRILIYKNQKEKYERWIYIQEHDGRIYSQDDLIEILTKESYIANCYKVGGEEWD